MYPKLKIDKLQEAINYSFKDIKLLELALRHRSRATKKSNERLEFLGDRVLGLVITEYLYKNFNEDEGKLSKKMSFWVSKQSCAKAACKIDLGNYISMSAAEEEAGGRENIAILGDACEALLAAVYLDGGIRSARKLILFMWKEILRDEKPIIDPKSELQEWAQSLNYGLPEYSISKRSGPDHAPIFTIQVTIKEYGEATAQGKSRKSGEVAAALNLLKKIQNIT